MTRTSRRKATVLALAACAVAAGCALAPQEAAPQVPIPSAWALDPGWRLAAPGDAAAKGEWWRLFEDPRLADLETRAMQADPGLAIARARLAQARAQARVTGASELPQVDAQALAQRLRSSADRPLVDYSVPNVSTVQNDFELGFTVHYELDLWGAAAGATRAAQDDAHQAEAQVQSAGLVLGAELAADYFNLCETDAEMALLERRAEVQARALEFLKQKHAAGATTMLDVDRQRTQWLATVTQAQVLGEQRARLEHALGSLVGIPAPEFHLPRSADLPPVPAVPLVLPSMLLERRPDVAGAERAVAAANERIGVARAAGFPAVGLNAQAGWEANAIGPLFSAPSALWAIGAAVGQSLFDGGRRGARVDAARAVHDETVAAYRQAALRAFAEAQDGLSSRASLDRAAGLAREGVDSARRAYDQTWRRYTGGVASQLDTLVAEDTLMNSEREATQLRGRQLLTTVYLVKALGGRWNEEASPPP